MTCFLKRGLPFALTLIIGLVLGNLLGKARHPTGYRWRTHSGVANGFGPGLGRSPSRGLAYAPRDVDQKARVLSRPEPTYTELARDNLVEGTVVLRAVFSEDGVVRNIRVVRELPYGLTEMAMQAALKIKFSPAIKNGRPVSQYIQIEYNFSLF